MRPTSALLLYGLLLSLTIAGCGGSGGGGDDNGDSGLRMGLLQFRTQHNLVDDACLPNQCDLTMEDDVDTAAWLDELAALSTMAVLHWDRPIPWLVFDADTPPGASRVDFYDGRIDTPLLNWINAFVPYFQRMPSAYLALSVLSGRRNGIQDCRLDEDQAVAVGGICPVLEPGTQISFEYGPVGNEVTATFDLARSYTNFVLYMYDKLRPDYLALMVETNLFKEMPAPCPANWDGLVRLYRQLYDEVDGLKDPQTKVFATLALQPLLDYNNETCHGPLAGEACTDDPPLPPAYGVPDPAICYPLDLSALNDLDQGDRLDILALSFYPDALIMDVGQDNLVKLYPPDGDATGDCVIRAQALPFLDPVAALDNFNWTKPVAIAELGARSDRTIQFSENMDYLMRLPADLTSQNFWLGHFLAAARAGNFEFYVQSFSDDFLAIGAWTVHEGILEPEVYSVFNNFAYMGIYDHLGMPKDGVTRSWLDALDSQ